MDSRAAAGDREPERLQGASESRAFLGVVMCDM
jgi:hypothetical protein